MKALLKIYAIAIFFIFSPTSYSHEIGADNNTFEQQMYEHNKAIEAFNLAMKQETIIALKDFISLYSTSPFIELAESTIERLQYDEAADKNTIEAYNLYLAQHPDSNYSEKAIYKKSKLINTVEEYDSYLTKYPKGDWRKKVLYKKARLIDTVEEYNKILLDIYPNNDTVIYYRDKAALNYAKKIGTKGAFGEFISTYPKSSWIDQAKYYYKYGYDLD